ncbi:MAG: hypothetical protein JWP81_2225 [Ferruginibacter sp.]|nr:hypothetical protein [Ferruginibacter sp.]
MDGCRWLKMVDAPAGIWWVANNKKYNSRSIGTFGDTHISTMRSAGTLFIPVLFYLPNVPMEHKTFNDTTLMMNTKYFTAAIIVSQHHTTIDL